MAVKNNMSCKVQRLALLSSSAENLRDFILTLHLGVLADQNLEIECRLCLVRPRCIYTHLLFRYFFTSNQITYLQPEFPEYIPKTSHALSQHNYFYFISPSSIILLHNLPPFHIHIPSAIPRFISLNPFASSTQLNYVSPYLPLYC